MGLFHQPLADLGFSASRGCFCGLTILRGELPTARPCMIGPSMDFRLTAAKSTDVNLPVLLVSAFRITDL